MQEPKNNKREALLAKISLVATSALLTALFLRVGYTSIVAMLAGNWSLVLENTLLGFAMFFLAYGNLLYHFCLIGHYTRRHNFVPTPRAQLDTFYTRSDAPSLSIIIPSYKEERNVNWQTMMSSALSEYPKKQVTLLIDDPYHPKTLEDILKLEDTRKIPGELQELFAAPAATYAAELEAFLTRKTSGLRPELEMARIADHYDDVANWLQQVANDYMAGRTLEQMHFADRFFTQRILHEPMHAHRALAADLRRRLGDAELASVEYLHQQYARLAGLFAVTFASFERKKYANLSHESNKAMNLNSYISVMGKAWKEVEVAPGVWHLVEATAEHADFVLPAADYVNTIDADSLMLGDYVLRAVDMMETPGNEKLAVVQSSPSSCEGAPMGLERTAGITLDMMFRSHQGYTHWGATFWVGANATLRSAALEDIKEIREENGHQVSMYIQDRTVIEDTESSIDLVHKGWQLANYPERMTFSANPSDFGSLLIQRRRWANGGLIILPKLIDYTLKAAKSKKLLGEFLIRFHYLAATTTGFASVLCFMFYSFSDDMTNSLLSWSVLPFTLLFLRDLRNTGYRATDFLRVCAVNLMLYPIIAGGVLKMFQQMLTGAKIPFTRTPKIPGRTAAPALYAAIAAAMPVLFAFSGVSALLQGNDMKAMIAAINTGFATYALVHLVGVRAAFEDMFADVITQLRQRFYRAEIISIVPTSPSSAPQQAIRKQA